MKNLAVLVIILSVSVTPVLGQYCENADFSQGNWNHWQGYTGQNQGAGVGCCPVPGLVSGRHTMITNSFIDPYTCGVLVVPPPGVSQCARLGNDNVNHEAEQLVYHFTVDSGYPVFLYQYAVVLEDPGHTMLAQPYFSIKVMDSADNLVDPDCGYYEVYSALGLPGFHTCNVGGVIHYRDWTLTGINLVDYAGQEMHIEFTTLDCAAGAHFGYAYLRAECGALTLDQSYCSGSDSVILTVPPGFSYQWNTGQTSQSITVQNPQIGANYYCILTSVTGCGFTLGTTIQKTILYPGFNYNEDSCNKTKAFTNTSFTSTGNILSSHWDFGDGNVSSLTDPVHSFPGQGIYQVTLTVVTAAGCDSSITKAIIIGDLPIAGFFAHDTCQDHEITFLNTSQPQSTLMNWSWDFGDGTAPDSSQWNAAHQYTTAGNFLVTLTVTGANGCQDSVTHQVVIYPKPFADFTFNPPICTGKEAVFTFTGLISPWTTYSWSFPFGNVISGNGVGPYMVSWADSGSYPVSLHLSDAFCGFSSDTTRMITVYLTPDAQAGHDTTLCQGQSIILGNVNAGFCIWFPQTGLSNPFACQPVASPQDTITYYLTVYNGGCMDMDSVTIQVKPSPLVLASNDTALCQGDTVMLQASGGISYNWNPPNGLSSVVVPNPMASPMITTTYFVTGTASNACTSVDSVRVTVTPIPSSSFTINHNLLCLEDTLYVMYSGNASPSGQYFWGFNAATVLSGSGQGPYLLHWNVPGTCQISLTVEDLGCISQPTSLPVSINQVTVNTIAIDSVLCFGASTGSASVFAQGGILPYAYLWSTLQTDSTLNQVPAGNYTVTVTDDMGCKGYTTIVITQPDSAIKLFGDMQYVSCQYLCDGEIVVQVTGGTFPYTYLWNTIPPSVLPGISALCPGAYEVTVTDDKGCITSGSYNLSYSTFVHAAASSDISYGPVPLSVQFYYTGTGAGSTFWDFGDNTTSTLSDPLHVFGIPGDYQVQLIINSLSPDFCTDTVTLDISVQDTSFLLVPNVITPNQDGFNDYFELASQYLETCSVILFNRWGTEVFSSNLIDFRWNGTSYDGIPVPSGTYYYVIHALGKDGKDYHKTGVLTVLR